MTRPETAARPGRTLRQRATDPLVPVVALTAAALLAASQNQVLTWALVGGLAGYTLSGSV